MVSNLMTRCRLSCQALLRSFLKNHRAHLEEGGPGGSRVHPPGPPQAAARLAGKPCPSKGKRVDRIWGTGCPR